MRPETEPAEMGLETANLFLSLIFLFYITLVSLCSFFSSPVALLIVNLNEPGSHYEKQTFTVTLINHAMLLALFKPTLNHTCWLVSVTPPVYHE